MAEVFEAQKQEVKDFLEQLKSWKDSSLFEMQEYQMKIAAVNGTLTKLKRQYEEKLSALESGHHSLQSKQEQLNQFSNEYMRIQNFIAGQLNSSIQPLGVNQARPLNGPMSPREPEMTKQKRKSVIKVNMSPPNQHKSTDGINSSL